MVIEAHFILRNISAQRPSFSDKDPKAGKQDFKIERIDPDLIQGLFKVGLKSNEDRELDAADKKVLKQVLGFASDLAKRIIAIPRVHSFLTEGSQAIQELRSAALSWSHADTDDSRLARKNLEFTADTADTRDRLHINDEYELIFKDIRTWELGQVATLVFAIEGHDSNGSVEVLNFCVDYSEDELKIRNIQINDPNYGSVDVGFEPDAFIAYDLASGRLVNTTIDLNSGT